MMEGLEEGPAIEVQGIVWTTDGEMGWTTEGSVIFCSRMSDLWAEVIEESMGSESPDVTAVDVTVIVVVIVVVVVHGVDVVADDTPFIV